MTQKKNDAQMHKMQKEKDAKSTKDTKIKNDAKMQIIQKCK